MLSLALLLSLCASPDLKAARDNLARGRFDDLLFAFQGAEVPEADRPEAAKLLGQAALEAHRQKDPMLALQFAQMALKHDKAQPQALEAGARAAFGQEQFESAERYADGWINTDVRNPDARLLRAELAIEAGEWSLALQHLGAAKFDGARAAKAKTLREKAQREQGEKVQGLTALSVLERRAEAAAESAKKTPARKPGPTGAQVVLYGTSWCGYCDKARQWFKKKRIAFIDKDVERDPAAADELVRKAAAAGIRPSGVPVIDVRGTLIQGFDPKALERAL